MRQKTDVTPGTAGGTRLRIDVRGVRKPVHEVGVARGEHPAPTGPRVVGHVRPAPGPAVRDGRVRQDLDTVGTREITVVEVVLPEDDAGQRLVHGDAGAGEDPVPRVDDRHGRVRTDVGVLGADDGLLGPRHRPRRPIGRHLGRIDAPQGVFFHEVGLVTDLVAVGPERGILQADVPVDGVGAQEGDVDTGVHGLVGCRPHHLGPVLVVPEAHQAFVVRQQRRLLVQVDVRRVGDVESEALGQEEEGELVADEIGRSPGRPVVGTVIRHHSRARRRRARADVERAPAPRVVRLRRGDRAHDHERRVAGVVAHDEWHVAVGAPGDLAHHLEEVVARRPVRRDGHREGRLPTALDHVRRRRHRGGRLRLPRQSRRGPDQSAARAPVVPGPVELDVIGERPGVDGERHLFSLGGAHMVAVAVEHAGVGHHPIERPGSRVLLHHPVGDRNGDTVQQGDLLHARGACSRARPGGTVRVLGLPLLLLP